MKRPFSCCGDSNVDDIGGGDGGSQAERKEREKERSQRLERGICTCVETSRSTHALAVWVTIQHIAPREERGGGGVARWRGTR